jgi:hypothetical protein
MTSSPPARSCLEPGGAAEPLVWKIEAAYSSGAPSPSSTAGDGA